MLRLSFLFCLTVYTALLFSACQVCPAVCDLDALATTFDHLTFVAASFFDEDICSADDIDCPVSNHQM